MGKDVGGGPGKSGPLCFEHDPEIRRGAVQAKWVILCCREKPLASYAPPVPQTDSGDQVENTEAIEQTMVKELGKMPP